MRNIVYKFLILSIVLSLFACEKVDFDSDYTITSYTESVQNGVKVAREGVLLHSFYADTSLWEIKSYTDAVAGRLTGKNAKLGETKLADATLHSDVNGVAVFRSLNQEGVVMIACDEASKRYAWRVSEVFKGLDKVSVSLTFKLWDRNNLDFQGRWVLVDDFVSERPRKYEVNAFTESTKGGDRLATAGISMHVFYADTLLWEVKNYADAVSGTISKRDGSGETMSADVSVLSDTEGLGILYIAKTPAIIVSSDSDKRYGWISLAEENKWRETAVTYQLWRREAKYLQDGWLMVDEIVSERPDIAPVP